ncbi:MAG: hypothetical protein U0Q11_18775 [Vicinamibacterales bacterium]
MAAVGCETNGVDPIFKFDRKTRAVLANFGKGVMVTHGISVGKGRQRVGGGLLGKQGRHQGAPGSQVQPEGRAGLGTAGKPGNADGQFNQPNDVVVGPDSSIYVADGHDAQGMITAQAVADGLARGATSRIQQVHA